MLWIPGIRKTPILSTADIKSLAPIGLFAAAAHGGSVLAMGAGAVSFAQVPHGCARAERCCWPRVTYPRREAYPPDMRRVDAARGWQAEPLTFGADEN